MLESLAPSDSLARANGPRRTVATSVNTQDAYVGSRKSTKQTRAERETIHAPIVISRESVTTRETRERKSGRAPPSSMRSNRTRLDPAELRSKTLGARRAVDGTVSVTSACRVGRGRRETTERCSKAIGAPWAVTGTISVTSVFELVATSIRSTLEPARRRARASRPSYSTHKRARRGARHPARRTRRTRGHAAELGIRPVALDAQEGTPWSSARSTRKTVRSSSRELRCRTLLKDHSAAGSATKPGSRFAGEHRAGARHSSRRDPVRRASPRLPLAARADAPHLRAGARRR